jgi:hypothetical protein
MDRSVRFASKLRLASPSRLAGRRMKVKPAIEPHVAAQWMNAQRRAAL